MPEPLSACLITMLLSEARRARVRLSPWVRLGEKLLGCINVTCVLILFRYASTAGLAGGGIQADLCLTLSLAGFWYINQGRSHPTNT